MIHSGQRGWACRIAAVIFGIIALLHLARLLTQTEVLVGGRPVSMSLSGVALLLSGGLAGWLWRASRTR